MSISNQVAHPLDPLAPEEIEAAAELVRAHCEPGAALRFVSIDLREPPKAEVLAYDGSTELPREANVVLHLRDARTVVQAIVSLTAGAVTSWRERQDSQTPLTVTELLQCEETVRADERWQAAMRRRGID